MGRVMGTRHSVIFIGGDALDWDAPTAQRFDNLPFTKPRGAAGPKCVGCCALWPHLFAAARTLLVRKLHELVNWYRVACRSTLKATGSRFVHDVGQLQ